MKKSKAAAAQSILAGAEPCLCGRPLAHEQCCGRYHIGPLRLQAPDPESLMRSRYSAFVLDVRAYLLDTWHPETRPAAIEPPEPGLKWLGLSIQSAALTGPDAGQVAFVARYKVGGRAQRLEETSRFVRQNGQWFYVDAVLEKPSA